MTAGLADVMVRFALYLDLMLVFGLPLFALHALRGEARGAGIAARYRQVAAGAAAVGLLLSLCSLLLMATAMSGAPDFASLESHAVGMVVTGTDFGLTWSVRVAALVACLAAARGLHRWPLPAFAALAAGGGLALATLAWAGHGAMDEGSRRYWHLAVDIVHLLAAGAWVGALAAFLLLAAGRVHAVPERLALLSRTANGFAQFGTLIVGALLVTGMVNYLLIVGPSLGALVSSRYGLLLLAKLGLFATMLALAGLNRYRLSPGLAAALRAGDHHTAVRSLRRSLCLESGCAVAVLAAVAWLGALSPG